MKTEPPKRFATAIRFKPEVHRQLMAISAENDLSLNWIVNRLLEEALRSPIEVDFTVPA